MRTMAGATLAWAGLLVLMVGNGILRVLWLEPRLGPESARRAASVLGIAIVCLVAWLFVRHLTQAEGWTLWAVGGLWLALTVAFELGFGHWVGGISWDDLLADYDLARGRLWPLVLLAVFTGPRMMRSKLGRVDRGQEKCSGSRATSVPGADLS